MLYPKRVLPQGNSSMKGIAMGKPLATIVRPSADYSARNSRLDVAGYPTESFPSAP